VSLSFFGIKSSIAIKGLCAGKSNNKQAVVIQDPEMIKSLLDQIIFLEIFALDLTLFLRRFATPVNAKSGLFCFVLLISRFLHGCFLFFAGTNGCISYCHKLQNSNSIHVKSSRTSRSIRAYGTKKRD